MSATEETINQVIEEEIGKIDEGTELTDEEKAAKAAEEAELTDEEKAAKEKEEAEKAAKKGLSETQVEDAKKLYEGLNDPEKAGAMIRYLAQAAGLEIKEPGAKEEIVKPKEEKTEVIEKSIQELVQEELGEKFKFLAPALSSAIEKVATHLINKNNTQNLDPLQKDLKMDKETRMRSEIDTATSKLMEDYPDAKKLKPEMQTILKEGLIQKTDNISWNDYLETVLFAAAGRSNVQIKKATKVTIDKEKSKKNEQDAAARLASEQLAGGKTKATKVIEQPSVDEAIREAMEEVGIPA